jgi:predicted 3-demethylubiquinone-9 3-methyltransferase (glyoxalase superfamily)
MLTLGLFFWNLLGGFRGVITAGLLFGAVSTAAYYVNAYDQRGAEIITLTKEASQKDNLIKVQTANFGLAGEAIKILDAEVKKRDVDLVGSCTLLTLIAKDKSKGADDQVHTTIAKVLEELKRQGL